MFSLNDQLQKFQKKIYNKQLDNVITIDDKFTSGGITIKDLVKQNHFIINQLRKMKDVFGNYCQLNHKVYKTIIQYQLGASAQQAKLKNMIHIMGDKIQQSVKTIKELHQSTVYQNQKSQKLFIQNYHPVKQELNQKVDQKNLTPLVKQIIDDYDNGEQGINQLKNLQQGQISSPTMKRKNRNTAALNQQLQNFRLQFQQSLNQIDKNILQNKTDLDSQAVKLYGNQAAIYRLKQQIQYVRDDIRKLGDKNQQQKLHINSVNDNLIRQINSKTNDSVWQIKLEQFNQIFVQRPLNKLKIQIYHSNEIFCKRFQQLPGKFDEVYSKIRDIASQIPPIRQSIPSIQGKVVYQGQLIQKLREDMKKADNKLQNTLIQNKFQLDSKILQMQKNMKHEINDVRIKLQSSANEIQIKVLKGVKVKFGGQIKQITTKIFQEKKKLQKITQRVKKNEDKIIHLIEIVSKKANFTDLLIQSQKKVNKTEMNEIKSMLQQQRDDSFKRLQHNASTNFTQQKNRDSTQRIRKKSMLTNRNLMTPQQLKNYQQEQIPTKSFMCGFDEFNLKQIKDDKKMLSLKRKSNNRHNKSLRATTAKTVGMFDKIV